MDGDDESWSEARRLIAPIGHVPSNFSSAVRTMLGHYEKDTPLTSGSETHVLRILRNNTVKATYYYCAKAYRPSLLALNKQLTPRHFVRSFAPIEHAVILSYCVLFRSFVKRCDKEEWDYIQSPFYEALEVGARIGESVPQIGLAFGLLSRGIRYLSFAAYLLADKKTFKEYRRHLRSKDLAFDMAKESSLWGCNNVQIASLLLEQVGFNSTIVLEFASAAERNNLKAPDALFGMKFRAAEGLLDHYMETGGIPTSLPAWTGSPLTLGSDEAITLERALNEALAATSRIEWLNKGSANINPKSTPEFFDTGRSKGEVEEDEKEEEIAEADATPG
jgi:hypothetical protein